MPQILFVKLAFNRDPGNVASTFVRSGTLFLGSCGVAPLISQHQDPGKIEMLPLRVWPLALLVLYGRCDSGIGSVAKTQCRTNLQAERRLHYGTVLATGAPVNGSDR